MASWALLVVLSPFHRENTETPCTPEQCRATLCLFHRQQASEPGALFLLHHGDGTLHPGGPMWL